MKKDFINPDAYMHHKSMITDARIIHLREACDLEQVHAKLYDKNILKILNNTQYKTQGNLAKNKEER